MSVASLFVVHLVTDLKLCTEKPLSDSVGGRQCGHVGAILKYKVPEG